MTENNDNDRTNNARCLEQIFEQLALPNGKVPIQDKSKRERFMVIETDNRTRTVGPLDPHTTLRRQHLWFGNKQYQVIICPQFEQWTVLARPSKR